MREAAIIAGMTILAAPVSWLTILAMSPQIKPQPAPSAAHHTAPEHYGRFVTPANQPVIDPLLVLLQEDRWDEPNLVNVRKIVVAPRPRIILVTPAEAPIASSAVKEIARICRDNAMSCVQLDLVTQQPSNVEHVLPHADILMERDVSVANRPGGLYLYDAMGHLRWRCPSIHIAAAAPDLITIAQAITAESLWQKQAESEQLRGPTLAPPATIDARGISKSPPPPQTKGRLHLSTIEGQVCDPMSASTSWTQLRNSWAVADYTKKNGKHPTLLVFWATWCGPCVKEFPLIDKLHEQYPNILFVGLADEQASPIAVARERINDIIKPYEFRLHYLLRDASVSQRIFNRVDVPLPAFALFDESGELVATQIGSITDPHNGETLIRSLDTITNKQRKGTTN